MSGYTPLMSSIVLSTIWLESKETKILFVTMLAIKDSRGIIEASLPGLAKIAGLTVEETETSLKVLSSEDKESKTDTDDGRRVEKIDGGWRVINHEKYRNKCRERAAYMQQWRKHKNQNPVKPPAPPKEDSRPIIVYKVPEVFATNPTAMEVWNSWVKYRRALPGKVKDWNLLFQKQLDWLNAFGAEMAVEIINQSLRNGWRGLFEIKTGRPAIPGQMTPKTLDPEVRRLALEAVVMIKRGMSMANHWRGITDKHGKEKKAAISKDVDLLLNNPEILEKELSSNQ